MSVVRFLRLWTPAVLFMGLIFFLSSRSAIPRADLVWDKLAHAVIYLVLGFLCIRACHGGVRPLQLVPSVMGALVATSYALLDELHQSRVPGRHAEFMDWVADAVGVCMAFVVIAGLARRSGSRVLRPIARRPRRPRSRPRR